MERKILTNDVGPRVGIVVVPRRETDGVDRPRPRDRPVQFEEGDVVVEGLGVVVGVCDHLGELVVVVQALAVLIEVVLAHADGNLVHLEPGGENIERKVLDAKKITLTTLYEAEWCLNL